MSPLLTHTILVVKSVNANMYNVMLMLINTCSDFDSNMDDLDEFEDSKIQKGTQANLDSVPSSSASKLGGHGFKSR